MLLFIDCETTGLIRRDLPMEHPLQPRLVSLAAVLAPTHDIRRPIRTMNVTVAPSGFTIPPEATAIHKITNEYAVSFGEPISDVLDAFLQMVREASIDPARSRLVGFNITFDTFVLSREMHFIYPPSVAEFASLRPFCVMRALAEVWKCQWPTLNAAYARCFHPGEERAGEKHNAMLDCMATIDMFEHGRSEGWWQ